MNNCLQKLTINIFFYYFIFSPIYAYEHWTIVTDETFNWETSYNDVKWLLFFYKDNCTKCSHVYTLLNNTMKRYFDKKVGFVLIDSIKCPWLVNRFNVTYLPKIMLLEDYIMYNYHSSYNEKNIINFIDKKKLPESGIMKPKGAKLKYIYKTYCSLLSHKINNSMQKILDKIHIPLKWNKYYTIAIFILFLIFLIFLFIFSLILFCKIIKGICCCSLCRRKKSGKSYKNKNIKEKIE